MDEDEIFMKSQGKRFVDYLIKEKEEKIINESNKLLHNYPQYSCIIYHMLGSHYMLRNQKNKSSSDYEKAVKVYKKLLNIENVDDKYKKHAILNMGFAYKALGMRKEAINYLEKSLKEYQDDYANNPHFKEKILSIYNELLST